MPKEDKAIPIEVKSSRRELGHSPRLFSATRRLLEEQFQNAARHNVNTARLGFQAKAYSDHSPIRFALGDAKMMSWNMLADTHLPNQFMTLSGVKLLQKICRKENNYAKKPHHFLSDLAAFLHKNVDDKNRITVTPERLEQFIHDVSTTDPHRDKKMADRRELIEAISDPRDPNHHEYHLAIQHACQLQEHLNTTLPWKKRYENLADDKAILHELKSNDFLCLQECTDPLGILATLNATEEKARFAMIFHKVKEGNDHCVLIYDTEKYQIDGEPILFGLNKGTKPCIMARFEKKSESGELTGEKMIIGSVHHPGGSKTLEIDAIMAQVGRLQNSDGTIPYCVAGDFNNTKDSIDNALTSMSSVHYHTSATPGGTMGGADYGSTNKAIDGVLSSASALLVTTITQKSTRVETKTNVHFEMKSPEVVNALKR